MLPIHSIGHSSAVRTYVLDLTFRILQEIYLFLSFLIAPDSLLPSVLYIALSYTFSWSTSSFLALNLVKHFSEPYYKPGKRWALKLDYSSHLLDFWKRKCRQDVYVFRLIEISIIPIFHSNQFSLNMLWVVLSSRFKLVYNKGDGSTYRFWISFRFFPCRTLD